MSLVVDASVVVAAMVDTGSAGAWAEGLLLDHSLVAPHLMPAEVTNTLRRLVSSGTLSRDIGALILDDLSDLPVDYYPFEPFDARVWELQHNLTAYDAWYVALAEVLNAPMATLDSRLARASGPRCEVLTP
jgi:predicted nucleic acid-binding protein